MLSVAGPIGAVLRFVSRYTGTQTSTKRIDGLSVDPELIKRALELSGERTKKAAVTIALQEFIARHTKMAQERIAQAEAQAVADVRSAAADAAVAAAGTILGRKVKDKLADDLLSEGIAALRDKFN